MEKVKDLLVQVLAEVFYLMSGAFLLLISVQIFPYAFTCFNPPLWATVVLAVAFGGAGLILRKR